MKKFAEITRSNEVREILTSIINTVEARTGIGTDKITMSPKIIGARKREYVEARQIVMSIGKKLLPGRVSLAWIGNEVGGRDHASVLHAIKAMDNLRETDRGMRRIYDELFITSQLNLVTKLEEWIINIPQL